MKIKKYCLYLIGSNIETGYIGVTNDLENRFYIHRRSKYNVGDYVRKNYLLVDDMKILCFGTSDYCFYLENKLRPRSNMGLNIAVGGHGGYTSYSLERNKKLSESHKNRPPFTEEHKQHMRESKMGKVGRENNANAKNWEIIDPDGVRYIVCGNFQSFCKQHKILQACLRKYKNKKVPPIIMGTCGGFRPKSKEHLDWRKNTTNWMVK
jgi:hypothetical protein